MKHFILALLLLIPSWLHAAVAHVQSKGASSSFGAVTFIDVVLDSPVTATNQLVAGAVAFSDSGSLTFSSSPSNTWVDAVNASNVSGISYALNVAAGTTTVTLTPGASTFLGIGVIEVSGLKVTAPDDGTNSNTDNTANPTTGAVVSTQTGLVFAALTYRESGATITETGGWTVVHEDESFDCCPHSIIYKIAAAASHNHQWTVAASPTTSWVTTIAALKEQPAGAARRPSKPIFLD